MKFLSFSEYLQVELSQVSITVLYYNLRYKFATAISFSYTFLTVGSALVGFLAP